MTHFLGDCEPGTGQIRKDRFVNHDHVRIPSEIPLREVPDSLSGKEVQTVVLKNALNIDRHRPAPMRKLLQDFFRDALELSMRLGFVAIAQDNGLNTASRIAAVEFDVS